MPVDSRSRATSATVALGVGKLAFMVRPARWNVMFPRYCQILVMIVILCGCSEARDSAWSPLEAGAGTPRMLHRQLQQQPEPRPMLIAAEDLPTMFQKPWHHVFPYQWQDYTKNLQAMQLPEKDWNSALRLVTNITQLNPAQLRRAVAYSGSLYKLRR